MKRLLQAQRLAVKRALNYRRIEYAFNTKAFQSLWSGATEEEKRKIEAWVEVCDIESILTWVRKNPQLEIAEWRIADLRIEARDLMIKNFSRMSKQDLVRVILERKANAEKECRDTRTA